MSSAHTSLIGRTWTPVPSRSELRAEGRAARDRVPRKNLAVLPAGSRDPMGILDAQDEERVPELVPIRTERMAASAFAFYRGTAALMAADLERSPSTDLLVGSCGDAHVSNFGLYASPQRTVVFDLNDFDEAAWAPWEWDVKRLVTSVVIAGQSTSRDEGAIRRTALETVHTYARVLSEGSRRSPLKTYYDRFDAKAAESAVTPSIRSTIDRALKQAGRRTMKRAAHKLTEMTADGRLVFIESPPTMVHVDEAAEARTLASLSEYTASANVDIRVLLQKYRLSDMALRVVGVGSVGTRCMLVLMQDGDGRGLLLQGKEAGRSVLIEHGRVKQPEQALSYITRYGDGGRVVAMQRVLQAVSDPFLGHVRHSSEGAQRDFYVRQFRDKKGGFEVDTLDDESFHWYSLACAATLARAHLQMPNAAAVAGYVGGGRAAGEAILEWAWAYADLSRADWRQFCEHRGVGTGA